MLAFTGVTSPTINQCFRKKNNCRRATFKSRPRLNLEILQVAGAKTFINRHLFVMSPLIYFFTNMLIMANFVFAAVQHERGPRPSTKLRQQMSLYHADGMLPPISAALDLAIPKAMISVSAPHPIGIEPTIPINPMLMLNPSDLRVSIKYIFISNLYFFINNLFQRLLKLFNLLIFN